MGKAGNINVGKRGSFPRIFPLGGVSEEGDLHLFFRVSGGATKMDFSCGFDVESRVFFYIELIKKFVHPWTTIPKQARG